MSMPDGFPNPIKAYYGWPIPEHIDRVEEWFDPADTHYVLRWITYRKNTGTMVIRNFDGDAMHEDINAAIVAMKLTD